MAMSPQTGTCSSTGKSRKLNVNLNPGSPKQNQTVEEEGASYLSRHGAHKRNTVHALASPLSMLTASQQRYARTPYAKQSPTSKSIFVKLLFIEFLKIHRKFCLNQCKTIIYKITFL